MKISSKTHYALKTVLHLAMHRKDGVMRISDIAKRRNIPAKFLEQILLVLKGGRIVASKRGLKGGYYLAQPPSRITLAQIIRLTGDSTLPDRMDTMPNQRSGAEIALMEVWVDIGNYMTKKLENITLQDMCNRIDELSSEKGVNYVI